MTSFLYTVATLFPVLCLSGEREMRDRSHSKFCVHFLFSDFGTLKLKKLFLLNLDELRLHTYFKAGMAKTRILKSRGFWFLVLLKNQGFI